MIYEVYSESSDMTFIMEETKIDKVIKVEVKGFYYGSPDKEATKAFYEKLEATFEED